MTADGAQPGGASSDPADLTTIAPAAASALDPATLPPPRGDTDDAIALDPAAGPCQDVIVDLAACVLGPYRQLKPIRPWKHGIVYSGVHPLLRRRVLLRVLADPAGRPKVRDDFLQAGRTMAAIDHPNVENAMLEAAAHPNAVYVAQQEPSWGPLGEFGPRDCQERLPEHFYPNRDLSRALLAAASGLQAIHGAGLAHGHLSTDCLRRGPDGRVRITGLGEEPVAEQAAVSEGAADPFQKDFLIWAGPSRCWWPAAS